VDTESYQIKAVFTQKRPGGATHSEGSIPYPSVFKKIKSSYSPALNRSISICQSSNMGPRLGEIAQKKSHPGWRMNSLFVLSLKPPSQV